VQWYRRLGRDAGFLFGFHVSFHFEVLLEQGFRSEKDCLTKKEREQLASVMETLEKIRAYSAVAATKAGNTKRFNGKRTKKGLQV